MFLEGEPCEYTPSSKPSQCEIPAIYSHDQTHISGYDCAKRVDEDVGNNVMESDEGDMFVSQRLVKSRCET